MGLVISTVADLNNLFNQIFEDAWFVAREANIMTGLVSQFSARGWMSRTFSKRPQITAKVKSEGDDFTDFTKWDKQKVKDLTPSMIMSGTLITDEQIETDPEDARRSAAQELGNSIAAKIDTDLVSDFAGFTKDKGPGTGQAASIAKFAAAISVLRNALAPNPIYVVCHPYHWHDIWTELGQPAATQAFLGDVANQALKDFYVGRWINVQWFVSANIPVSGSDAVSGVFNSQALVFDSRRPPRPEQERDITRQAWEYVITAGYAHGVRRNEFGVKFTADATEPA